MATFMRGHEFGNSQVMDLRMGRVTSLALLELP